MAAPGGLTVVLVVLFGVLGTSRVAAVAWGQRHFFWLDEYERSGCLPKGFELQLPGSLWVNAMLCRRQHVLDWIPGFHPFASGAPAAIKMDLSQRQRTAIFLSCMAKKLDIVGPGSEVDRDSMNAFIDTLPADAPKRAWWKTKANLCLQKMPTLSDRYREAVFVLSCFRSQFVLDCTRGTALSCRRANDFLGVVKFSQAGDVLNSPIIWRNCSRQVAAAEGSAFTNSSRTDLDFCPDLLNRAEAIGVCVLQEAGHAIGDALNMTAVLESVEPEGQGADAAVNDLQKGILRICGSDSAGAFVRCWINTAPSVAAIKTAADLALALPQTLPPWPY